jgi:hypothetical protein
MNVTKLSKIALAVALAVPAMASAESAFSTGATPLTAQARLNFQITIPRILYLQVGSGGPFPAVDGTIDTVTWSLTPAQAIVAGAIAPTSGVVAVQVRGNGGDISLNSNTPGPLLNDAVPPDQLAFTTITATSSNANLDHPAFAASGNGTAVTLTAAGRVVNESANWTFSYAHTGLIAEGIYGGTIAKQGQVTYTATIP